MVAPSMSVTSTTPAPTTTTDLDAYWAKRDNEAGSRKGEAHGPKQIMTAYEVSDWLQVPRILRDLQAGHGTQIRLVFPEPATTHPQAAAIKSEQEAIQKFFRDNQKKAVDTLMVDLESAIRSSDSFKEYINNPVSSIATAQGWIDAHLQAAQATKHHFGVTEVVPSEAHNLGDPKSKNDMIVSVESAIQTKNVVAITVPCDAAAQALLAETLSQWISAKAQSGTPVDITNVQVWVGPGEPRFGAAAAHHIPLTVKSLHEFLDEEALKKKQQSGGGTSVTPPPSHSTNPPAPGAADPATTTPPVSSTPPVLPPPVTSTAATAPLAAPANPPAPVANAPTTANPPLPPAAVPPLVTPPAATAPSAPPPVTHAPAAGVEIVLTRG